jgi:hypothetical protein
LLGHSDIAITLRVYGHLLPSMQGEAVEKWEDVFKQGDKETGKPGSERYALTFALISSIRVFLWVDVFRIKQGKKPLHAIASRLVVWWR